MRPFNCLSADCPIFGPHLLEASAGTGKTFSIEHVIVRLLLEAEEIEIEQILAVTFTRAATRDLKRRIRSNIQEALSRIRFSKKGWEYLNCYLGSEVAARKLDEALSTFDRCQIFTIHGFCHRMLQEFAFEANLGLSLSDPEEENGISRRLYGQAKKFIECGIGPDLLCPEQMACLLKECDTIDELIRRCLQKKGEAAASPFSALLERYTAFWTTEQQVEEVELLEAFDRVRSSFKMEVKGDFEEQIRALVLGRKDPAASFRSLLRGRGTLFAFLDPSNKKVKAKEKCPQFFEEASRMIRPLIQEAMDRKKILGCLQKAWKRIEASLLFAEQSFNFEEILERMKMATAREPFASSIRKKYRAVIIDEFQDTDPLQWEIFKTLFLDEQAALCAFYLVGDPKQSIYRFRKADIYTYFEARDFLGPSSLFCLDTNYRSSPHMISALNALFSRDWLTLPKRGRAIPCPSVKSHSLESISEFSDGKGAVHFIDGHSFERSLLPYAISEIEKLLPLLKSPSAFAILVRDRYQAEIALRLFQERSIPVCARSHIPLGKTLAFQSVQELIKALALPRDNSLRRKVAAGPFGTLYRESLDFLNQSFILFCRQMLYRARPETENFEHAKTARIDDRKRDIVYCEPFGLGSEFHQDLKQVVEELLAWESSAGFSIHGLLRFLEEFERLDSEEGGRRRLETDEDAVQILTLHVSKGLEFDVVFALGCTTQPPEEEAEEFDEADAERLRQLYVAMTRAKKRLYIPLPSIEKKRGASSPMELFCRTIEVQEGPLLPFLKTINHVTCEKLSEEIVLNVPFEQTSNQIQEEAQVCPKIPSISPCFLQSFTSLAQSKVEPVRGEELSSILDSHTIPKGANTGILIHQIFEQIFSAPTPIWRDAQAVASLVFKQLEKTPLFPWEKVIQEMVWNTLHLKLGLQEPFSLVDLTPGQLQVEMEFLFSEPPHFVKGYIDLVFRHRGKFFLLDWKTNWLGSDNAAYLSLDGAMESHDYWLQAKLYAEALRRHVKQFYNEPFEEIFGGAIYLFVRGGGVCHFKPDLNYG